MPPPRSFTIQKAALSVLVFLLTTTRPMQKSSAFSHDAGLAAAAGRRGSSTGHRRRRPYSVAMVPPDAEISPAAKNVGASVETTALDLLRREVVRLAAAEQRSNDTPGGPGAAAVVSAMSLPILDPANDTAAAQLIPSDESASYLDGAVAAVEINSLIFTPRSEEVPATTGVDDSNDDPAAERAAATATFAVAVVRSTDKVDVAKLSTHLSGIGTVTGTDHPRRWELAPSHLVRQLCGFEPGCVPPLGHVNEPTSVVIDRALMDGDNTFLLGGGGSLDRRCLVREDALLESAAATVGDIAASSRRGFDGGMNGADEPTTLNGSELMMDEQRQQQPKPFFPVAPPSDDDERRLDRIPSSPHRPVPVTAVGRLVSVRQIAKKLVFADLGPPEYRLTPAASSNSGQKVKQEQYKKDMPWRSGEDGRDMYVQIIVGKTYCEQFERHGDGGDDKAEAETMSGPERLKALKPGRLVLIRGAANVDPNQKNGWDNTSGNWAQKRSLDVIVSSFEVLAEDPEEVDAAVDRHLGALGRLPWERKRGFERRAVAGAVASEPATRSRGVVGRDGTSDANTLTLSRFNDDLMETPLEVKTVDDAESVKVMADALTAVVSKRGGDLLDVVLGIDCEWRPRGTYSDDDAENPVALLQMSAPALSRIFLIDTHALLRSNLPPNTTMTTGEAAIATALGGAFRSASALKVGFRVADDFARLAASFPHVPAFRTVHGVVELSAVAQELHDAPTIVVGEASRGTGATLSRQRRRQQRSPTSSLRRLTQLVLKYDVSKAEQCSDWEARPLTESQLEYAALDCALPPRLLDEMAEGAGTARMVAVLPGLTASWHFDIVLEGGTHRGEDIRLRGAKRVVGDAFLVSRTWITGEEGKVVTT